MSLKERFEQFDEDYLDFAAVPEKLSQRADMHAFMLLDKLVPTGGDIVSASVHDEFYLGVDVEQLEKVVTDEQIHDLVRCGVRFDSEFDCLSMYA